MLKKWKRATDCRYMLSLCGFRHKYESAVCMCICITRYFAINLDSIAVPAGISIKLWLLGGRGNYWRLATMRKWVSVNARSPRVSHANMIYEATLMQRCSYPHPALPDQRWTVRCCGSSYNGGEEPDDYKFEESSHNRNNNGISR